MKKLYPMGIIFLVFLVGTGFILYPSVGNLITLNTASVTIANYEKVVDELEPGLEETLEKARLFNEHLYYGTNGEDEDKCLNLRDGVICYLDMPVIDVYLPVYYGISDEVLKKGCGYVPNTSLPVGGANTNSAISGHTGLPGAELLSALDRMKEKDVFYIHVLGEILAYEVDQVKVVGPEASADLEIVPGEDHVTLVTCTPYGINSHRLLVRGSRIPYVPEKTDSGRGTAPVKSGLSAAMLRQLLVIGAIVLALAAALAAAVLYRRKILKQITHNNERRE
ncbi:MAG: class C sortase [Lachnospiraceae bacterium]|nr:class C sortase [Lachnospiraceae bacterium]